MSKNVAVFVDVANIFYAAKAAGVDIDYVTLLKAASAGRDLVRAYAYTGLDPDNENQRNFHDFLRRHGYKVVSKDIRKYGDGKVKANLDIELVVDMMKTARNLDIAIVVSGDGDFAPAIRAVQEQGVRVEVVSFRGNTSSDLMDVADQFTDITQIAKVEKGSSRSGRRVADDDADLSMTEVPDKQSEGAGDRTRGRGRTRRATAATSGTRERARVAASAPRETTAGEPQLVVLPGEKLSRAAVAGEAPDQTEDHDEADAAANGEAVATRDDGLEDGPRRRRRRGGRGRGRGRAREDEQAPGVAAARDAGAASGEDEPEYEDSPPRPARRPSSTFGSIWDSQIGVPAAPERAMVAREDEDLEEPEIPEYLLTERRQREAGRGARGGRGRGGAYAAALDRERFGGGRGSTPSRFAEPARREGGYGRPDREPRARGGREDRGGFRDARPARSGGDEPWSEVPPEIEAMLRAQMGSRPARSARREDQAAAGSEKGPRTEADGPEPAAARPDAAPDDSVEVASPAPSARRSRARRSATRASEAAPAAEATEEEAAAEAPTRSPRARSRKPAAAPEDAETAAGTAVASRSRSRATKAPTARTTSRRSRTTAAAGSPDQPASPEEVASAETAGDASAGEPAEAPAPKRRATRRKAEPGA